MEVIPTYTIIAQCFADVRHHAWSSAQLVMLDMAIDAICDQMSEANSRFDPQRFRTAAQYHYHRPWEDTV